MNFLGKCLRKCFKEKWYSLSPAGFANLPKSNIGHQEKEIRSKNITVIHFLEDNSLHVSSKQPCPSKVKIEVRFESYELPFHFCNIVVKWF